MKLLKILLKFSSVNGGSPRKNLCREKFVLTKEFGIKLGFVAVKTRFSLDIIIFCHESAYFAKDWVMITDITCFKNSRQNRMFNIIRNHMIYDG